MAISDSVELSKEHDLYQSELIVAAAIQRHRQKRGADLNGTGKKQKRVETTICLDLMRAAAMLLIVFYHMNCEWSARLMESSLVVTKIGAQGYLGWQGVSLFILVSGAAQCISYERCSDLKTYYKKRWWSIFPSFYMAYFVCYLMGGFGGGVKLFDLSFLWTITGLDGYASLFGIQSHYLVGEWFIGMILVLYIVFPVLYALVKRYPKSTLIAAILYYLVMVQLLGNTGRVDKDILLNVVVFSGGYLFVLLCEKRVTSHSVAAAVVLCLVVFVPLPERVTWYLFAVEGILWYLILWQQEMRWIG